MKISLIVAYADNFVIGKDNDLVWSLPDDMKYFSTTTRGHHVIMGRKNWESIPAKYRPLPNRPNIILTRNQDFKVEFNNTEVFDNLTSAIEYAEKSSEQELFIIGGSQIYQEALPLIDTMYITEVHGSPEGDTFFPSWNHDEYEEISRIHHEKDSRHQYSFDFVVYKKKSNH